jgi:hypothetical protein
MKIRAGFVTNSSSAAFIIEKKYITELQYILIKNHRAIAPIFALFFNEQLWDDYFMLEENENYIIGRTAMDNFDMNWFLEKCLNIDHNNYRYYGNNSNYNNIPEGRKSYYSNSQIPIETLNYMSKKKINPCETCLVRPICTKSFQKGTMCNILLEKIIQLLHDEKLLKSKEEE